MSSHLNRVFAHVAAVAVVLVPSLSAGQGLIQSLSGKGSAEEDDPNQVRTVSLVLRPAAEPKPALRYQLLPGLLDRKPGNAAVMYNKVALLMTERNSGQSKIDWDKIVGWLDVPLADLPRKEVAAALAGNVHNTLEDLDLAARRETCNWELPLRERNFITLLLPEVQHLRSFGRLMALRARLQIAEGRFDDALRTMQTGYALGRHAAEGPTLINGLVGIAICQMMSQRVQELVQQPGAPNLYWALTCLPRPLIDMRPAAETEMNLFYLSFPALGDAEKTVHGPAYWDYFLDEMTNNIMLAWGTEPPKIGWRAVLTMLAIKGYPTARRNLIEQGRSPQEVDAMPVAQVVTIYTMQTYNELRDESFKWFYVPYWEAQERIQRSDRTLCTSGYRREIIPLAKMMLPAVGAVNVSVARNDRGIAVLQTIEALRIYGAAHDGQLPEKLADIAEVPLPIDPVTGKPFIYQKHGDTAVLESPAPLGRPARDNALRYEIKFRR